MAKPRPHLPGVPIHITARGVGGRAVFLSDAARQRFLRDLLRLKRALPFFIHAYCLMTNHIHLLLEAINVPISEVMKRLLGQHAQHLNSELTRVGHVFQGRYGSSECLSAQHYRNAMAYIAKNPVRASLVSEAADWPWSSHLELIGKADSTFLDRQRILETLGGMEVYEESLARQTRADAIRISTALLGKQLDNELFREMSGVDLKSYLDSLAQEAAKTTGLLVSDVVGNSAGRRESLGRKLFIEWTSEAGIPGKYIAAYLGRSASAISRLKQRSKNGLTVC